MRKPILALILLFFVQLNHAQRDISVEFGSVFKNDKREIPIDIIGKDENGYYLLYSEGKYGQGDDMYLRQFNLDLTPSGKEINLKDDTYEGKFNSLGLVKIKDNITHVFYLLTDEGKTFYYQNTDLKTFSLGPKQLITTIENDTKSARNSLSRFMISEDENTIFLFYTIPNKNKETAKIRVQTFDSSFNEKSISSYELPFKNDVLSFRKIFINNKNELFILCKKYDSYKILADGNNKRYEYLLYKVEPEKLNLLSTVRSPKVHLRNLNITLINDNELILSGLTSKKNIYAMTGVFSSKINLNTGEKIYSKHTPLSAEFFAQLLEDGKKKNKAIEKYNDGKRENQNYVLQQTLKLDNDEVLVLAEQVWSYTYNYATTYYHHNIAAIKLDANGDLIWAKKIGKRNDKPNVPIYSSYFPICKNNHLFLLYNCSEKNLNHKSGHLANYFTDFDRAFIATDLNLNTGDYIRKPLIRNFQLEDITIRPLLYNWMSDDTLLMFGQDIDNLKNQRFVKIKFNPEGME
ncbi:hypothetical protein [Tamlana crocina]|uniref:Uncharacterized protein n=1 Tax=Tamlana crocina TaxID=393006 RepID=A0ABX1DDC2_9FLAO|nr:hypothetical protein [Tamlana crocina]NJX16265.1 hypothetical protein [Tamlana crocina]